LSEQGLDVDKQNKKSGVMHLLDELKIGGPTKLRALALICEVKTRLKRTSEAIKACTDALEIDEHHVDSLCNRAEAHVANEDYEAAVRDYSKAKEAPEGGQSPRVHEGLDKAHRLLRQSKKRDYYKILGVPRDADERTIKKAYRKKAMAYHPDKFEGPAEEAEKKMAEINAAYEVLSNAELKAQYDSGRDPNDPTGGHEGHGHPFGGGGGGGFGGMPIFFQGGGPFGGFGSGGGGGGGPHFEFRY